MPQCSCNGMPGRYPPTHNSSCSSEKENPVLQNPTSSPALLKTLHDITPSPWPSTLACPVSSCSLVFKGKMPYGYLWRHLRGPGLRGRTGDEKAAWLNLHKIEHDKLLATHITPAQRKREANKVKAQKLLRAAGFEQRARGMGITEKGSVAQKVAIWEGMCTAEQSGDGTGYYAWVLLDIFTSS